MTSFSREEATELAKRYGGQVKTLLVSFCSLTRHYRRVTGQPSSKTSYVVLGDNAGPSKIAAIKKHNLISISEDQFLDLIATRHGPSVGGKMDDKLLKKLEKDNELIKEGAKELEKRERMAAKAQQGRLAVCVLLGRFLLTADS